MISEHQYIFSALSQNKNFTLTEFVKLGLMMEKMLCYYQNFSKIKIKTLDLPSILINS